MAVVCKQSQDRGGRVGSQGKAPQATFALAARRTGKGDVGGKEGVERREELSNPPPKICL